MRFDKRINIEAILKLVILLGFALFFSVIIYTGRVTQYVHPRIVPYLKFGIAGMVLISLFSIEDIFKPKRKINLIPYVILFVPLVMAFSLPAVPMDTSSMSFNSSKSAQQPQDINQSGSTVDGSDTSAAEQDDSASGGSADASGADPGTQQVDADESGRGLKLQGDTIVLDDNNFVQWIQEIYNNMGKYEGKKIQVTGFVFKTKDFKPDEFVPARLMMVCCAADLQPLGLMAHYDKASGLVHDTWYKVTGKIGSGEFKGQKTPVIEVEGMEKVEKPKNEYVYPY